MSEKSDESIAREVQLGNTEAYGTLVQRYEAKLKRYASKFLFGYDEADDLVQETFIRAYVNINDFDTDRRFSPWVYRIAHNLFINAIKKKGRESLPFFDPDTLFPHPVEPRGADHDLKEQELRTMMDSCLKQLAPKYREVLVLYYYEEIDYQAISDVLRIPISTVGVRLSRARIALRKAYEGLYGTI